MCDDQRRQGARDKANREDPMRMFDLGTQRLDQATQPDPTMRLHEERALRTAAFEDGFGTPNNRTVAERALRLNIDALELFGPLDQLDTAGFVDGYARISRGRLRRIERFVRTDAELEAYRSAGRFAGVVVALRLVAREPSHADGGTDTGCSTGTCSSPAMAEGCVGFAGSLRLNSTNGIGERGCPTAGV